ncbi:hypothetical protein [Amycolatopsis sp. NPDC051372]|uniref:hypothetical protein n=1 Tax=unclassified Amycolatopsis TaxID=2618356 RepID=UPI00343534BC
MILVTGAGGNVGSALIALLGADAAATYRSRVRVRTTGGDARSREARDAAARVCRDGGADTVTTTVAALTDRPASDFADFVGRHRAMFG